jgi:hypothetical protein
MVVLLTAEPVFQKISVLAVLCGRIQAGHVSVVRMNSFIIGKWKRII